MKKKIVWIGIIVLVLVIAAVKIKAGGKAAEVDLGTVQKGSIDKFIEETAVVKLADETSIYSSQSGRVAEMLFNEGDSVKAGDKLARLDDRELVFQQKALIAQKQSIAAQYEELKNPADSAEISKYAALVKSAEASYKNAKREADSNKALYDSGSISYNDYQASLIKLETEEASLEKAKSDLALARKGISGNVRNQYEAEISGIQAQIEEIQTKLDQMVVTAPISGIVMTRDVESGSMVQPGTMLYKIGGNGAAYLESDILADEIGSVKVGQSVLISNEDMNIKDVKGTVRKIYPTAFSKTSELGIEQKRVKVEISIDGSMPELRSGYDMNIKIITESKKDTLIISDKAVFEYQGKDCVFVADAGVAKLRQIEKGIESDDKVEVTKGLKEGEKVILSPDAKMNEGAKVKQKK